MAQTLKYVIGKDYRPLTVLEAKGGNTFTPDYDKGNWVQARQYEDNLRQVFVEITNEDGSAYDLTGANVLFEGILPDNEHKILDNSHVVFYEDPTTGKFRFDMPAQAFSVAGQYKQAFFRVMKDYRNIATLEFKFEVLADMVISGLVARDYLSPLEDFFNAIKDEQTKDSAELKKIVDDKINEITDLMTTLNQTNTATLGELNSAKTGLEALEDKIKQNGLFTQGEAEEFKATIQNTMGDLSTLKFPGTNMTSKIQDEFLSRGINVKWFGAMGDGTTDDSTAFKNALDFIKNNYYQCKLIIPSGNYVISETLIIPPYITIAPIGIVKIISNITQHDIPLFWIRWRDDVLDVATSKKEFPSQEWQGTLIDDTQGKLSFYGSDKQGTAIEIGDRDASDDASNKWLNVARSSINGVNIANFEVGIMLNPVNVFLMNFYRNNIQKNSIAVKIGDVSRQAHAAINSGENMVFTNCIFANCDTAFDLEYGGFDLNFNSSAFDFNGTIFKCGTYPNSRILVSSGNIEGNNVIYDGSSINSKTWKDTLTISNAVIYIPDVSEIQFKGPLNLLLDAPYLIANDSGQGQLLDFLIDGSVTYIGNNNTYFSRRNNLVIITDKGNELEYGNNLSKIKYTDNNHNSKILSEDNIDISLKSIGIGSALSFTKTSSSVNWENFYLSQKLNCVGKTTFLVYLIGVLNSDTVPTINVPITYYSSSDEVVGNEILRVSVDTNNLKTATTMYTFGNVPKNASYFKITIANGGYNDGKGVQIGYIFVKTL